MRPANEPRPNAATSLFEIAAQPAERSGIDVVVRAVPYAVAHRQAHSPAAAPGQHQDAPERPVVAGAHRAVAMQVLSVRKSVRTKAALGVPGASCQQRNTVNYQIGLLAFLVLAQASRHLSVRAWRSSGDMAAYLAFWPSLIAWRSASDFGRP